MSYIKINEEESTLIWLELSIALETDQKRTVEHRAYNSISFYAYNSIFDFSFLNSPFRTLFN